MSAILKALNVHSRTQAMVELARRGVQSSTRGRACAPSARRDGRTARRRIAPRSARPRRPGGELYDGCSRTTVSMLLGAAILCFVLRRAGVAPAMAAWLVLVRRQPGMARLLDATLAPRPARSSRDRALGALLDHRLGDRGRAVGPRVGGHVSAISPPHQALLIVCIFGVVLGGLNLTAVYRPSFYGFALPALLPLIVRVALEGDPVHSHTALVMSVVLVFILAFGHSLNDVLTHALAMRYENIELIEELKAQTRAAHGGAHGAETANRGKSQLLAAASHDLRQPLHALALFIAALAARTRRR